MSQPQVLTVQQAAARLGFSEKTTRKLFRNEVGVIKLIRPGSGRKQPYVSLRIPESVFVRVYRRLEQ